MGAMEVLFVRRGAIMRWMPVGFAWQVGMDDLYAADD
jgi:hypothetical protein